MPFALFIQQTCIQLLLHLVRFGALKELSEAFPNNVYGLSDHTTSNLACFGAVALGASILERHFTDRMDRSGPDIIKFNGSE